MMQFWKPLISMGMISMMLLSPIAGQEWILGDVLSGLVAGQGDLSDKEEEEMTEVAVLEAITRQVRQDMIDKHTAGIDHRFMEGAHLEHITGYRQSKGEWLASIQSGQMAYFGAVEEAMEVTLRGQEATVVMRQRLDARIYGSRHTWPLELTFYYVKQGQEWRVREAVARTY